MVYQRVCTFFPQFFISFYLHVDVVPDGHLALPEEGVVDGEEGRLAQGLPHLRVLLRVDQPVLPEGAQGLAVLAGHAGRRVHGHVRAAVGRTGEPEDGAVTESFLI